MPLSREFLQIGADAHDLAGGHHLGAQNVDGGGELVEGEPGQLGDDVVQLRLKGGVGVGDFDVLQRHAHGDFRGDPGNGIAGGLGGQRGGTGDTGVDLNEIVSGGIGVESKLNVAAALHLQRPDDLCSVSAKIVIARKRPEATLRNKIISVFFFKFHAERFQLLYRSDRFLHKRPNDIWVAHAVSCAHDVRVMHIRTVLCAAPSVGDAEPGCFRYRIAGSPGGTDRSLYRQNDVRAAVLRGDCRAHSCDACTNDQNIAAFCLLHMHLSVSAAPGRKRFHA